MTIERGYWMSLAFSEARLALEEDETPVGAVIVKEGILLGRGHNRTKKLADPTAHAEILAISAACQKLNSDRLDGCEIYVTLEPCPMCGTALVLGRVEKLFYAAEDPRMGGCGSLLDVVRDPRMPHRLEVYRLGEAEESQRLLSDFFKSRR